MDVKQYDRFSDVIRAVRKERHISQREMARTLEVSAGYVGQWELGLSKPSEDVVRRICRTYALEDVEHMIILAFSEGTSVPDTVRDILVHRQHEAMDTQTPLEQRILAQARRVPAQQQELLLSKLKEWVDALVKQGSN